MKFNEVTFNKVDWSSVFKNPEHDNNLSSHSFEAFAKIWEGEDNHGLEGQKDLIIKFETVESNDINELGTSVKELMIVNSQKDFVKYHEDKILIILIKNINDDIDVIREKVLEEINSNALEFNEFSDIALINNLGNNDEKIISLSNGNKLNFTIEKF